MPHNAVEFLTRIDKIGYPYFREMNLDKAYEEVADLAAQTLKMHHRLEVIRQYLFGLRSIVSNERNRKDDGA